MPQFSFAFASVKSGLSFAVKVQLPTSPIAGELADPESRKGAVVTALNIAIAAISRPAAEPCPPRASREFVAHDSSSQFGSLNHRVWPNAARLARHRFGACGQKWTSAGRQPPLNPLKMIRSGIVKRPVESASKTPILLYGRRLRCKKETVSAIDWARIAASNPIE